MSRGWSSPCKVKDYVVARRTTLPQAEYRQSKHLNSRIAMSHQPARRRERQMRRFKSARHAQSFPSTHARTRTHVQLRRYRLTAAQHRAARDDVFRTWCEVVGIAALV